MFNLICRACCNPTDYGRIVKCHHLRFTGVKDLGENTREFTFECSKPFKWNAGQHAIFSFPDKQVKGKSWRVFSIASSPHEGVIKIATTFPPKPSDFKQKLLALQPGDKINMRGPIGEFYLKKDVKKVIGVAGGVGITPFRSILSEMSSGKHENVEMKLIYAGRDNYFAYEEDFKQWSKLSNVEIIFVNTPDEVNAALDNMINIYHNEASYYISGSPGMIGALNKSLKSKQIRKIVSDPFKGY